MRSCEQHGAVEDRRDADQKTSAPSVRDIRSNTLCSTESSGSAYGGLFPWAFLVVLELSQVVHGR